LIRLIFTEMELQIINLLALGGGGSRPGEAAPSPMIGIGYMVIFMVMMWVIMIRPQQKRAKDHAKLLTTLRRGDKVVTNSGITGVVISVNDNTVSLRSADSKLDMLKNAISEITERTGDTASDK
jgi:preprotein translocase subunit YajC